MSRTPLVALLACSASKAKDPLQRLTWTQGTDLEGWNKAWDDAADRLKADALYTGRGIVSQLNLISAHESVGWTIISAGAGLILPSDLIPPYEATFRKNQGPVAENWSRLPLGGLQRLSSNCNLITFAPPAYQRAILHDPIFETLAERFIVGSNSILAPFAGQTLKIHPRMSEILGCSKSDMATFSLRLFLEEGQSGFERVYEAAKDLKEPRDTRKVSDSQLLEIVRSLLHLNSLGAIVRHLRDSTDVAASYERVRAARNSLLNEGSE